MPGGVYVALSGLRHRAAQLDQLASDIANAGTSGYKSARSTSVASERASFAGALQSAIDVAPGPTRVDFRAGTVSPTGRDLDFAIEGRGFFVVDTPAGDRFTRNGHFMRSADGTLVTADGFPLQTETEPGEYGSLVLPTGAVSVEPDGTVQAGNASAGKLRLVDFDDYTELSRESAGRFASAAGVTPLEAPVAAVRGGVLEQSNVSIAERLVQVIEVSRTFEALQRGISLLMNDVDGRAISELGKP